MGATRIVNCHIDDLFALHRSVLRSNRVRYRLSPKQIIDPKQPGGKTWRFPAQLFFSLFQEIVFITVALLLFILSILMLEHGDYFMRNTLITCEHAHLCALVLLLSSQFRIVRKWRS